MLWIIGSIAIVAVILVVIAVKHMEEQDAVDQRIAEIRRSANFDNKKRR